MIEIHNRSITPYKEVCYIQTYWPDGTVSRASGSVVGVNDVLTALHVVYDASHGGWAAQIMVTPGADIDTSTFSAPYGTYAASNWIGRTGNWDFDGNGLLSTAESSADMALIGLNVNLGAITGILGTSFATTSFQAVMLGYPARGTGLMQETGYATSYSPSYSVYHVNTGLGAGASGGPILDTSSGTPLVRGVLSGGDKNDTYSVYSGLNDSNVAWYTQALTANDDLLLDSAGRKVGAGVVGGTDYSDTLYEYRFSVDASLSSSVYGYKGADIAVMSGYSYNYSYNIESLETNVLKVTNNNNGLQVDLHDVNVLSFADKYSYILSENQAQIARLYTVLDRVPDIGGLDNWLESYSNGMSFSAIANSFTHSQEFLNIYNTANNQSYVMQLYSTILDRPGDSAGVMHWTNELDRGMSRDEVMTHFTNSLENHLITESESGFIKIVGNSAWTSRDSVIQKGVVFASEANDSLGQGQLLLDSSNTSRIYGYSGGDSLTLSNISSTYQRYIDSADSSILHLTDINSSAHFLLNDINVLNFQDKSVYILSEDQAQIARLYTVFDRIPDFDGLQNWLEASSNGMSFDTIANSFSQSQEFALRYNAVNNYDFANQLYNTILGRAGEEEGLGHWTNALNSGLSRSDAMIQFTESTENHLLTEGDSGFIQIVGSSAWA
ncbi:uncharacterized protein DUF4214 [Pseudomonas duriflava]|uniref:Uncharacterized protein DUF4214 n=1 Tax=Pseudomonas duriflava TaxID=459528 RepID=A0A562PYN9_9PSED|nr:DUF4214 domain-containing protein [Pseudomonas duriflava]TWI49290.1 uncharacterized protein DUF4214 [Pseudomonas duriflava]